MTEPQRRAPRKYFDPKRAAQILADVRVLGSVKAAAEKWGVTEKTVNNYQHRIANGEAEVSVEYGRIEREQLDGWAAERVLTLKAALKRARTVLETETDLRKIAEFVEAVGGVDVAKQVLDEGSRAGEEGAGSASDAGGAPEEGDGEGLAH